MEYLQEVLANMARTPSNLQFEHMSLAGKKQVVEMQLAFLT